VSAAWGWVIVTVGFLALLVYDGALVSARRVSMSAWLIHSYRNRPYIPFLFGFVLGGFAGHLFFPLESCLELLK
jgi:hypothetical protein